MTTLIPKYDIKDGGLTPAGAINRPINEKLAEFVSVKDFGALGDATTDDTTAINNAAAYCDSSKQTLYFPAGEYRINGPITVTQEYGIFAEPSAFITAIGTQTTSNHCFQFVTGIYSAQYYVLPRINGFGGKGILLAGASYVNIYCPLINGCQYGVQFFTGAGNTTTINNTVRCGGISSCTEGAVLVSYDSNTVSVQSNIVEANFAYANKYVVQFGGPFAYANTANQNRFTIDTVDGTDIVGSKAIYCQLGGLTAPNWFQFRLGLVAFENVYDFGPQSSGQVIEAYFDNNDGYDVYTLYGTGNKIVSANLIFPTAGAPVSAELTANSRAAFNSGVVITANRIQCGVTTPSAGMVAGDTFDCYVYSPFTSGNGSVVYSNNVRVTVNEVSGGNLKIVPLAVRDNSDVNLNEIKVTFIALGVVPASNFIEFTVDIGY